VPANHLGPLTAGNNADNLPNESSIASLSKTVELRLRQLLASSLDAALHASLVLGSNSLARTVVAEQAPSNYSTRKIWHRHSDCCLVD
jgi:hypothetical protein